MDSHWNIRGLVLEGISGSGKTTLFDAMVRSPRFASRAGSSAVLLTEHQTQRVLERRQREQRLAPGDCLELLESHVAYLETLQDRLDAMVWCRRGQTAMRLPFLLERFHLSHVCHHRDHGLTWEHVEAIDRRLAALDGRLLLLTVDPDRLAERVLRGRDEAWRGYLRGLGESDAAVLAHFRRQQERMGELAARSCLVSHRIDTSETPPEQVLADALDFWGVA